MTTRKEKTIEILINGDVENAINYLDQLKKDELHIQRIKKKHDLKCLFCGEGLYIASNKKHTNYLKHYPNDKVKCPFKEGHNLTKDQINAIKFNGAKEGINKKFASIEDAKREIFNKIKKGNNG